MMQGDDVNDLSMTFMDAAAAALQLPADVTSQIRVTGTGTHPSTFAVADFAAGTVGTAALAIRALRDLGTDRSADVVVDRRLASLWFAWSIVPDGWELPGAWDSIAGDYATADGWIRLHTNAPHHKAAALHVLQCDNNRDAVAASVATWPADALETAIVEAKGCAAAMRNVAQWQAHPQGKALATEPLIAWSANGAATAHASSWSPTIERPLRGLKVLDLTRVLAGPVSTRFLAGYGADVLRIDPPDWDEPSLIPEVTLGKRCARLDIRTTEGRKIFERLLAEADVLVHGYRPGALDGLGFDEARRRRINPALIDVSLDAYGWTGPWRERRGFDSLVQMSTGIADAGKVAAGAARPVPLPFQALDQATGYLMAASVVRGLIWRATEGRAATARLSLSRTAKALIDLGGSEAHTVHRPRSEDDVASTVEPTQWGAARRCRAPVSITGTEMQWALPASGLGSVQPTWHR